MPEQLIITDEMKRNEAEAWKRRLKSRKHAVAHEIRTSATPKFINADIVAPLQSFQCSDAANDALDAALEAAETIEK